MSRSETVIERVGELPLLLCWLQAMHGQEIIDCVLPLPHANRHELSGGQLAVLVVAYVIHSLNHRLCAMQELIATLGHSRFLFVADCKAAVPMANQGVEMITIFNS